MPGQGVSKLVDETANLLVLLPQSVTTKRLLAAKTDLAEAEISASVGFWCGRVKKQLNSYGLCFKDSVTLYEFIWFLV